MDNSTKVAEDFNTPPHVADRTMRQTTCEETEDGTLNYSTSQTSTNNRVHMDIYRILLPETTGLTLFPNAHGEILQDKSCVRP